MPDAILDAPQLKFKPDESTHISRGVEAYGEHVVRFIGTEKPWPSLGQKAIQYFRCEECAVYFIGGETGPIKIGSSVSPLERLATFQIGSPVILKIHALAKGGLKAEREYQARFAAHRLHGEWHSPHPDILAEIDRLASSEGE